MPSLFATYLGLTQESEASTEEIFGQGQCLSAEEPTLQLASKERRYRAHLAEIKVNDNESIESALRRFKRKVQQEDIIKEIKKHSFYMKPGDKRRAKQALARKRQRKKMRREQD